MPKLSTFLRLVVILRMIYGGRHGRSVKRFYLKNITPASAAAIHRPLEQVVS